jgi:signal transduction histidine kinase
MSDTGSVMASVERAATVAALRRLMLLLLVLAIAACSFVAWYEYHRTASDALHEIDDISRIAQEHALDVLAHSEIALNAFLDVVADRPDYEIQKREESLHRQAGRAAREVGAITHLILWDEAGRALVSGRNYPVPGTASIADRRYFLRHKQGAELSINALEKCRAAGMDAIVVTKTRYDSAQHFAGVLMASISPHVFIDFYRYVVRDHSDVAIEVVKRNGKQIVGYPDSLHTNLAYRSAPVKAVYGAVVDAVSAVDGSARYALYRQVGEYPAYLVVSRSKQSVFAEWRHDMAMLGAVIVPGIVLVLLLVELAARKARHEQNLLLQCHAEEALRIEAEAEVRHVQKLEALGQLIGGIAHDFNGLLQVIANGVSALEATARTTDTQPQLAFIRKAVLGAKTLSAHLLTLSRKRELKLERVRPQVVIPEMCDFAALALPAQVKLHHAVDCDAWDIFIDRSELELAIINLVVNARDAMAGTGEISVRVRNVPAAAASAMGAKLGGGDYVALSVRDTGPGISETAVDHLFEPFFTTKPEGKGTGLGLSSVSRYAVELGGVAVAENAADGGAIITMYIPRAMRDLPSETGSVLKIRSTSSATIDR